MINIFEQEGWKIIPTNSIVTDSGKLVMGAGLARQAWELHNHLPEYFGKCILEDGIRVWYDAQSMCISFPTKTEYSQSSKLWLIKLSLNQLKNAMDCDWMYGSRTVYWMPRIGCGLGGLNWDEVKPLICSYLQEHIDRGQLKFTEP